MTMKKKSRSPKLQANFISRLFFWWVNPIFEIRSKRDLEEDDMFDITDDERSRELGDELEKAWLKEVNRNHNNETKPSLCWALFWTYWKSYTRYGCLLFIEELVNLLQPILLSGLIRYFTKDVPFVSKTESYIYATGVCMCALVLTFVHHQYYIGVQTIGMKMKVACSSLIYRQSLQLSSEARRQTSTGQINNLLSNDVRHFSQLMTMLHFLWIGVLEIIAVLAILCYEIGPPATAGFLVMILMVLIIHFISSPTSKYRKSSAMYRDNRLNIISEIIKAIKAIKLYCWETPFGDFVRNQRKQEMNVQRKLFCIHLVQDTLTFVSKFPYLLPVIIWMMYASIDLRASSVFLALRIYDHTGLIVGRRMYRAYFISKDAKVSLGRIQNFLLHDKKTPTASVESDIFVDINIKSAKWQRGSDTIILKNVSARVDQGQVLTIAGPVGCGKTSILMAIMNELPEIDGTISFGGRVSYASQQPWIFSGTIKRNIILYNEDKVNNERYNEVIRACALDKDFSGMSDNDETLIGDRGMDLSGGQKSRVSLARCLYRDADIYLLDDPLSAVDSQTGQHIYERVIQGLLREKAVILVTHQRQFLRFSDKVIFISKDGTMVKTIDKTLLSTLSDAEIDELSGLETENVDKCESDDINRLPTDQVSLQDNKEGLETTKIAMQPNPPKTPEPEGRRKQPVTWSTYFKYFKSGTNVFMVILVAIAFLATQGSFIFSDWWLSKWANQEEDKYTAISKQMEMNAEIAVNTTHVTVPDVNTHINLSVLGCAIVVVITAGIIRAKLFFKVALDASRNLHNSMLKSILATNVQFFEKQSITGQIQNRFSRDVRQVDETLPKTYFEFLQCSLIVFGIVLVAGMSVMGVYILLLPLMAMFVYYRWRYIWTSSQIRRLQSTTLSPINGHATTTQEGIYTIRAFNVERNMLSLYDDYQDKHTQAVSLSMSAARWFAVKLDLLCALFVIAVTFSCVKASDSLDAGSVGLSITYTMSLMALFQWCVRQSAEVDNQMVSVERMLEYINLHPESTTSGVPPQNWPDKGVISFQNASLKYSQKDQPVLRNLFFTIREKEKVGIVGRTGAGKSSLVTMLFRLVEPDGVIFIDGENIKEMDLHTLRKSISIIPQDPALFSQTLRRNIDPFCEFRDEDIWDALDEVQLKEEIESLPKGIDTEVTESGNNFSVGQRQLICLARVVLSPRKIVIIDEATANVDNQTDAKIQRVIRKKFNDCTVLTIAHRLKTVMDSDRLLVLDEGEAMFDEAHALLQNQECSLLKMVEQTGNVSASRLKETAKDIWERRHGDKSTPIVHDEESSIIFSRENTEMSDKESSFIYSRKSTEMSFSEDLDETDEKTKLLK